MLTELWFGATFFVAEGFEFRDNKRDSMSWQEIAQLHREGFEISNHTRDHLVLTVPNLGKYGDPTIVATDPMLPIEDRRRRISERKALTDGRGARPTCRPD